MKRLLLLFTLFYITTCYAQQWSSTGDIENYYNNIINGKRQKISELRQKLKYANSLPDKDASGITNIEKTELLLNVNLDIEVLKKDITLLEGERSSKLEAFRKQKAAEAEARKKQEKERQRLQEQKQREEQAAAKKEKQKQNEIARQKEAERRAEREAQVNAETARLAGEMNRIVDQNIEYGWEDVTGHDFGGRDRTRKPTVIFRAEDESGTKKPAFAKSHPFQKEKEIGLKRRGDETESSDSTRFQKERSIMLQRADKDISDFLRLHLGEDDGTSYSNFIINKVCEYYGVDYTKLMMGADGYDEALTESVIESANQMAARGNVVLNQKVDKWHEQCHIPTWNEFAKGRTSQQVLSMLTIMTAHNSGDLPEPLGSDNTYDYYYLKNSGGMARVKKGGETMEVVPSSSWRIGSSFEHYIKNGEQGNPLATIIDAFPTQPNEVGFHTYRIDENGKGTQSSYDGQKKIYSSIETPEVEFISPNGSIRIKNNFFYKESTPWVLTPSHELDVSLSLSKGLFSGSVSSDATVSGDVTIENPVGASPYGKIEKEVNLREGTSSTSVEVGAQGKAAEIARAGVGLGVSIKNQKDENGNKKQSYWAGITANADVALLSIRKSLGYEVEPGKSKVIRENSNNVYHYLPSNLQENLVNDLFKKESNKMNFYINEYDMVLDAGGMHEQHHAMTKAEKDKIHEQLVKNIRSANVPDVIIQPSNIQFIDSPLYSRHRMGQSLQEESPLE